MYNRQLETFLEVARLGSFSKAARAMYITPSAVIQQVNHLEEDLGAELLTRSSHGVSLTAAGRLVYQEGVDLVRRSKALRIQLAEISNPETLTIGTQFLSQPQLFPSLWAEYWTGKPAVPTRFVMLKSPWEEETEASIVETVMFRSDALPGTQSLALCEVPLCFAVPPEHPLARKDCLHYEDLTQTPVVTICPDKMDRPLKTLWEDLRDRGVELILVQEYTPAVFNACRVNGAILQIPACWDTLCMGMKILPCSWGYKLPYGFFYHPQKISAGVRGFLQDLQTRTQRGEVDFERRFSFWERLGHC